MRKYIILALVLTATNVFSQINPHFGVGFFGGNQKNNASINLAELQTWDNFQFGVPMGEWASEAQIKEFQKRTDARLFGGSVSAGAYFVLANYSLQGVDSQFGININNTLYIQDQKYNDHATVVYSPSIGLFADFGFRLEVGAQDFAEGINWYMDLDVPFSDRIHMFARYQRGNPFTNDDLGVFVLDNSPITLETFNAGIRIKF